MDARLGAVLLGALALSALAVPAAGTQSCSLVCVTDVSLSSDTLAPDEEGTLSFTVTNEGSESVTFRIVLVVAGPDNETQALELTRPKSERTLAPGESVTFQQPLNPETPGTHGLQLRLVNEEQTERFDATDPVTVTVQSQSAGLGGPIDRTEIALGALIGALGGMGLLVRRN